MSNGNLTPRHIYQKCLQQDRSERLSLQHQDVKKRRQPDPRCLQTDLDTFDFYHTVPQDVKEEFRNPSVWIGEGARLRGVKRGGRGREPFRRNVEFFLFGRDSTYVLWSTYCREEEENRDRLAASLSRRRGGALAAGEGVLDVRAPTVHPAASRISMQ